jgi:polyisoprenoid-binding protein YceI
MSSLPLPPGTYAIDTMHTQIGFAVTHLDISVVSGTFDEYSGSLTIGEELADTSLQIEAVMTSINSGNSMRDETVRGENFLDVESHPTLTFASTGVTSTPDGYALAGDLTIKGVTRPITLDATYNGSGVHPLDEKAHYGFSARGSLDRGAFGVDAGVPLVSADVKLTIEAQFIPA